MIFRNRFHIFHTGRSLREDTCFKGGRAAKIRRKLAFAKLKD
jgi:hypothetical protein